MSKDGFDNENLLIENLNNKRYIELNDNLKKFVKYINNDIQDNDILYCEKHAGLNKTDLTLIINNKSFNISVKKGTGNSVHQEKLEDFIIFLDKNYDDLNDDIIQAIKLFIWGDGTLDGTGKLENRIDARTFHKENPELINIIKNFFYKHKHDLIKRFLITGLKSEISPDFIYYGSVDEGVCISAKYALEWLCDDKNESNSSIPVGRLTFQAWNRNINGGDKSEHKRGVIQLKWAQIKNDLILMNKMSKKNINGECHGK